MTTHATRPHASPRPSPDATERLTIAQVLDRVLREPPRWPWPSKGQYVSGDSR